MSDTKNISLRRARLTVEQRARLQQRLSGACDPAKERNAIRRRLQRDRAPLSFAQQRQWFLWQLDPQGLVSHQTDGLRFVGHLDVAALRQSFQALLERHESLRTVFRADADGVPEQIIEPPSSVDFACVDLAALDDAARNAGLCSEMDRFFAQPFDLTRGPLFRLLLVKMSGREHQLLMVIHHIIADGWSTQLVLDELATQYRTRVLGTAPELATMPIQYADYAAWQRQWLQGAEGERQLAWWREQLGGEQPVLALQTDKPRQSEGSHAAGLHTVALSPGLVGRLREQARAQGGTLFATFLAALQALMFRYTGQNIIRIGVPTANRNRAETAVVVGLFVNTQVLPACVDEHTTLEQLRSETQEVSFGAQAHQDLPFEKLVEALRPERSLSSTPLFQVMYNHLRWDHRSLAGWPGVAVERVDCDDQAAQFELTLETSEYDDGSVVAKLRYAKDLFLPDTICRLATHYLRLLESIATCPQRKIVDVALLADSERQQLHRWGVNARRYAHAEPIHRLIERQACKSPRATAVMFGAATLSYAELDARANRLAHRLIGLGVAPEVRVGIAVERSLEMVVGLLAIMKAGGVYVPLDPDYPRERLSYMLQDSGIELLLTQSHLHARLPSLDRLVVLVLDEMALDDGPAHCPAPDLHVDNLVYVIYTSGTTGRPKGVANRHRSLYNRVVWGQESSPLQDADVVLQKTPFSFDISFWELFWPLTQGAKLALAGPGEHRDPARLIELVRRYAVTTIHFVPSMLQAFVACADVGSCTSLRRMICSGEALPSALGSATLAAFPDIELFNLYGPTEAAIEVTHWACHREQGAIIPIGQPIADTRTLVLDANLNLVPQGVAGELYLGGIGLARGYSGRPGLSSERFVADPFTTDGERLYRTGDRVRWNEQGQIEYLGRIDHQVKIRGFRIEPGEIEAELLAQPEVREAVVVTHEGAGGVRLVAYVVCDSNAADISAMRHRLSQALPDYMVPSAVVVLERLPLNANGKLDRKALPEPESSQEYAAPRGEVEKALAAAWSAVLGVERIGREDNFFELGGDSILSLRVVARARESSIVLTPRQLFQHQTLSALALHLSMNSAADSPVIPVVDRSEPLALSFAQSRQWFLWRMDERSTAYHVSAGLTLRGELNLPALRSSFAEMVERHESLRTVFRTSNDGSVEQAIQASRADRVELIDLSADAASLPYQAQRITRTPFDLTAGPALRVALIRMAAEEHVLVVVMHHIVSDGWSMQILMDEFVELYRANVEGGEASLKPLAVQYVDYAAWQGAWLEAGERQRQLAYWRKRLGNDPQVARLPTDHPRTADARYRAAHYTFELPAALTTGLHRRAREHRSTLFMALLSGFQALLHRYTQQRDIRVGLTNANRHRPQTQGVVGFFVNTQVLRSEIDGRMTLGALLDQVRAAVAEAQDHQDLPFEQLVEALQPERSLDQPLFQVMIDHQRSDLRSLGTLPGLTIEPHPLAEQEALFDLWMNTVERADGSVGAKLSYADGLFEPATIARLSHHYLSLLQALAAGPDQAIGDVRLLGDEEQEELRRRGMSGRSYSTPVPLHRLIERQAGNTPRARAVCCGEAALTYADLNRRANQLAHRLIALGVQPESRVGVALERSIEMVVALLAILKAGAAYVPLDTRYPRERLNYMIQDSGIQLLLAQASVAADLPATTAVDILLIDALDVATESGRNPQVSVHPDNLAYVIYTSGSAGRPKGAQVSHRNVARLLEATREWFQFDNRDVWTMFHSCAFDFSVWEVFGSLCYGGRLVVVPFEVSRSPDELLALLRQQQVTVLNQTPSAFRQLLRAPALYGCNDLALRAVIFGGEALDPQSLRPWIEHFGDSRPRLVNMYGITETTVHVTYRPMTRDDLGTHRSLIGRHIPDLVLRVLDTHLNAVPLGVPGELHVAGAGLARGYLDRAGLSAERFIADPFSMRGDRLYRTGDRVRWTANGEMEYLGRIDRQVKIRGFRIELGEIESVLSAQPEVHESAVIARGAGEDQRLVAYVGLTAEALQTADAQRAPERGELVSQWEAVFDGTYESDVIAPDFRGWHGSYTDAPIPADDMREWLGATVERIASLSPGRVLEIGCGVGLLVQHVAPLAYAYVAMDFSPRAVKDLQAWISTQPALMHVEVQQREATDFSGLAHGKYDTVILNSVAQYFPDADYLIDVLRGAAEIVGARGRIFIGDLRHLAHLPMFHASVQLARCASTLTLRELKSRIDKAVRQEKELVVDPALFRAFAAQLGLGAVETLLKRGCHDNELTRYRYDVVLRGEVVDLPAPEPFDWTGSDVLERIAALLSARRPAALSLRSVPNKRMARDLAAWQLVQASDDTATVGDVLSRLESSEPTGIDPEALWALGEAHGYDVHISWTEGTADGAMDAQFIEPSSLPAAKSVDVAWAEPPAAWRALASDPSRALRMRQLGTRLRERLSATLPDYMIPAQFVVLEALPLTANGKLDCNALPAPEYANADHYEAPQSEAERALAAIWSEVLGVERIGRHDSFFELGGHSLALIKARSLLVQRYGMELSVKSFFEQPTLSLLAAAIPAPSNPGHTKAARFSAMQLFIEEIEAGGSVE